MRKLLTEKFLRGLKPAPVGKRLTFWDSAVPGLCIRVTDKGSASFTVMRRLRGQLFPIRRVIGFAWKIPHPAGQPLPYSLADARGDARAAVRDISLGVDPKVSWAAQREAEAQSTRTVFAAVAKEFLADHVAGLRSANQVRAIFKNELIPVFGKRPVAEISDQDIARLVKSISKTRPYQARHAFANLSKLFRWAVAQRTYGLTVSPCTGLSERDLIGKVTPRDRVPDDGEIAAIWQAATALGYPAGSFTRMLILTGGRLREVAEMTWDEVDLDKGIWTIGASRMKGKAVHVVPLAPEALTILESIPRGRGPFVFSTTDGRKPIVGFSKMKKRLDAAMPGPIAPWRFHDLRRAFRTGLSMLGVPDVVSELCIAHSQKGLHKTYDRHAYLDEKRAALTKWERHALAVCEPTPANVIEFAGGRRGL
jgi:integrase